jgi:hypothetical protein
MPNGNVVMKTTLNILFFFLPLAWLAQEAGPVSKARYSDSLSVRNLITDFKDCKILWFEVITKSRGKVTIEIGEDHNLNTRVYKALTEADAGTKMHLTVSGSCNRKVKKEYVFLISG